MCVCVCVCVCGFVGHRGKCVGWLLTENLHEIHRVLLVQRRPRLISVFLFSAKLLTVCPVLSPLAEPFLFLVGAGGGLNPEALVCSQHRRGEEEGGCGRGAGEVLESIHYISIDPPLFFTALSL